MIINNCLNSLFVQGELQAVEAGELRTLVLQRELYRPQLNGPFRNRLEKVVNAIPKLRLRSNWISWDRPRYWILAWRVHSSV